MKPQIGLYYPFIHFRNEDWVKLAALYWDKIARIVPWGYETRDSETVQQLQNELGFIHNLDPINEEYTVGQTFIEVLKQHEEKLRDRYHVDHRDTWPDDVVTRTVAPKKADPKLAYIFSRKIVYELREALTETGLATFGRDGDSAWLGMHPKLASIYMLSLADTIAASHKLHPLADETLNHVAVSGYTMERISQALLRDVQLVPAKLQDTEIQTQMMTIAIQSVIPQNIAAIPVSKIVKLREKHRVELTAFQDYVNNIATTLPYLEGIESQQALKLHLDVEYEKRLKPLLADLRASMKFIGADILLSAVNVEVKTLIANEILQPFGPVIATTGAIACSVIPVFREKRKAHQQEFRESPAAYLLRLEENLKPETLTSRVIQRSRQFIAGV